MLNESVCYVAGVLTCDGVPLSEIAAQVGTPVYVYSLPRILSNYQRLSQAFAPLNPHIHFSAKANANLDVLRALVGVGAGIDAVSGGEIARALKAGVAPQDVVFAGVGKTPQELAFALAQGVGWFNVENVGECHILNELAAAQNTRANVALRYNPDVQANTHPNIATGHKGAKFGLNQDDLLMLLNNADTYPHLNIRGLHVHVGSQLGDTHATREGVLQALSIARQFPQIDTLNIGGGFPNAYTPDAQLPAFSAFAEAIQPLLTGYNVILEPGRSIVADAGVLLTRLLYVKQQGGETLYIVDASMTELMRPALYHAHHEIMPLVSTTQAQSVTVVGPVCETTDVLGKALTLPPATHGDLFAILDVGAYGMVMANNYNQRPRPAEVITDGQSWRISRRRETFEDLLQYEQ